MRRLFGWILLILSLPCAVAAEDTVCRAVDGPANLRSEPNGKIVASIPARSTLRIGAREGEWVRAEGARQGAGYRCQVDPWESYDTPAAKRVNVRGWLHASNLLAVSEKELYRMDPCGAIGPVEDARMAKHGADAYFRAKAKADCTCASNPGEYHDANPCSPIELKRGRRFEICEKASSDYVTCLEKHVSAEPATTCPSSCLELEPLQRLTPALRKNRLTEAAKAVRPAIERKLGPEFASALRKAYPEWMPLLYAFAPLLPEWQFTPRLSDYLYRGPATIDGRSRKVSLVLVYKDVARAVDGMPSWILFDESAKALGKGELDFSLYNRESEAPPTACLVAGTSGPRKAALLHFRDTLDEVVRGHTFDLSKPSEGAVPVPDIHDAAWIAQTGAKPDPFHALFEKGTCSSLEGGVDGEK
jgi:hypothetical protein